MIITIAESALNIKLSEEKKNAENGTFKSLKFEQLSFWCRIETIAAEKSSAWGTCSQPDIA